MNELTPGKVVGDGKAEAALHKSATDLDTAGYQLLLEELQFDERCLEVYKGKLSNFEVRVAQLRDSWRQKRNQHAKDAILKWMDFNVSQLVHCMLDFLFCWYLLVIGLFVLHPPLFLLAMCHPILKFVNLIFINLPRWNPSPGLRSLMLGLL